ncbi:MAG TPA: type-F conjugative transfer system secretin TraK [Lamprocystis sp. (in: g-proteobacteria)]|nr:type-F conjugative transfer system secretin TraK [Lamprocystis sp. (in: g-proteobacteria)]
MALILWLTTTGPGYAADRDPDAAMATPRVSCDLLDVRTDSPRTSTHAAWANPQGGGPAIRQVGGRGTFPTGNGAFLKVGLGPGQVMPAALELGPRTVSVPPGTTALVEIAIDHLNRIVTPFQNPVVHTVSAASTSVDGRVVYVATATEEPVALYIGDGPSSDLALSLTLAPRSIPPREIRLVVPGYRGSGKAVAATAAEGTVPATMLPGYSSEMGANQPYVETIADLLRAMAQRRLPPGYQVRKAAGMKAHCAPGLKIVKTQLTQGPTASVLTLGLRNTGADSIPANESACDLDKHSVAAVGAWPLKTLASGQETEVFLVLQEGTVAVDPTAKPQ